MSFFIVLFMLYIAASTHPIGIIHRKGYPVESLIKTVHQGSSPRHVHLDYDVTGSHNIL